MSTMNMHNYIPSYAQEDVIINDTDIASNSDAIASGTDAQIETMEQREEVVDDEINTALTEIMFPTQNSQSQDNLNTFVYENEIDLNYSSQQEIQINSQEDFDNLISGVTDASNWSSGVYVGSENLVINLNTSINMTTNPIITGNSAVDLIIKGNNNGITADSEIIFTDFKNITISDVQFNNTVNINNTETARTESVVYSKLKTNTINNITVYGSDITSSDMFDISGNIIFDNCNFSNCDNVVNMNLDNTVCKFMECTINPSGSVGFVCNNNASVGYEFDGCSGSFENETGGFINTSKPCTYVTITNSDFTKCSNILQKQTGTICTGDITITNSDFTECTGTFINISMSATGSTDHIVSNSTFSFDETLINTGTYGFSASYMGGINFTDVEITGFETAIDHQYSGGTCVLTRVTVNKAKYALNKNITTPTSIDSCNFYGDGSVDSRGILISGAGYNETTGDAEVKMTNTTVSGFEIGVDNKNYVFLVKNSEILECDKGLFTSSKAGTYYVIDSTVIAKENASSDSYGIYSGMNGVHCADTTVKGFNIGVGNISLDGTTTGQLAIVGCELDNKDTNVLAYGGYIYNCKLVGAEYGVKTTAHVNIFDSYIEGKSNNEGIGISEYNNTASLILSSYEKTKQPPYNSSTSFNLVRSWSDKEVEYKGVTINKFKDGIKYDTTPVVYMYYSNIHSCDIGIDTVYTTYLNESTIYNCSTGISSTSLYPEVNGVTIYNCNLAITDRNNNGFMSATASETPHIIIHDCQKGIEWSGNMNTPYFKVYNISGDGITLNGTSKTARIAVDCYNNDGKNIIINNDAILYLYDPENSLKSEKGLNVYIDGKMYIQNKDLISDNAIYYLTTGTIISSSPEDFNLNGVMVFDFEESDYTEGREVMYGYYDALSKGLTNNQFFTNKEGWIVDMKSITPTSAGACDASLVLTEGCIVTYDYAENGGISIDSVEKQQYKKGSSVNLTPIATKAGYEFVGWNTDKNATEGLTTLTANTSNITLYAIYKKNITITYHTYDDNLTYSDTVTFYNKESSKRISLLDYDNETYPLYDFSGYVLNENSIINNEENLYLPKEYIDILITQTDVYCVYKITGSLSYKDKNKALIKTVNDVNYIIASDDINNLVYSYVLEDKTPEKGYTFVAWKDSDGNTYEPNVEYYTTKINDELIAIEEQIMVQSIEVNPESSEININDTVQLSVVVLPEDAFNKAVEWYSEDTTIATVDENGLVTGIKEGTVKIYAKTTDGSELSDFSTVIVIKNEPKEPEEPEESTEPTEEPEKPQESSTSTEIPIDATLNDTPIDEVKTGDEMNVLAIFMVGGIAGIGLLFLALLKKSKEN